MEQIPTGWYEDPWSTRKERYWDGFEWTLHTRHAAKSAATVPTTRDSAESGMKVPVA